MDFNVLSDINDIDTFKKLPHEMKRYVYDFIDYDTKIDIILDNKEDFMTNKHLYSILTFEQIRKVTDNGLIKKIYSSKNRWSDYNRLHPTLHLSDEIIHTFPNPVKRKYTDSYGDIVSVKSFHPMLYEICDKIHRVSYIHNGHKAKQIIDGFRTLRNVRSNARNMIDADYLISKFAYHLLVSLIIYCEVVKKDRIERSKKALAKLTVKKALREKKKLQEKLENTEREMHEMENRDTREYKTKIKRMRTRFMKENVYMQYVKQGMTLKEAKEKIVQDRENKKQDDKWEKAYNKAVKEAVKKAIVRNKIKLKEEKKREKDELVKRKKLIAQVTKTIKSYSKLAKQAARAAKKKMKM